jgi:HlyD family secretion protein
MKSRNNQIIFGIVALLVVGAVIAFLYTRANAQTATKTAAVQTSTITLGTISTNVAAAGTVRARQSAALNWQNTGMVSVVDVKIGDVVTAGQELAVLSTDEMPTNVVSAQADLVAAQQAFDNLLKSTTPQATALQALENAQTALNNYINNFPATQAQAKADLLTAQTTLTTAQNHRLAMNNGRATQSTIDAAQATYDQVQNNLKSAQKAYDAVAGLADGSPRKAAAYVTLYNAQNAVNSALGTLNWYSGQPSASDFAIADSGVSTATQVLAAAQQAWDQVSSGSDTTQKAVLQATVSDAQRAYDLVKNGPNADDVAAAKARIYGDQTTINSMKIIAPFGGTITDVSILPRDQVNSGDAAFTINDMSHMLIDVSIAEYDISNIQVGQPAEITFDAISGKTYQGKVVQVSPVGATSSGVVTFTVTVEMTNTDKNVHVGMTAAVNIITATKQNVLTVPNRAIRTVSGKQIVIVLFEGNQTTVPVTVGLTNDTASEISGSGLKDGDTVVLK